MSHFNVSLNEWAKSQDSVHKPQILERRERRAETDRTKVLLLTSQAPYRQATPAHDSELSEVSILKPRISLSRSNKIERRLPIVPQSHCIPIPVPFRPNVPPSCCVPVPFCTHPIGSPSHCAPSHCRLGSGLGTGVTMEQGRYGTGPYRDGPI